MPVGPGAYDEEVTALREKLKPLGILLAIFGGNKCTGFSVQASRKVTLALPKILRTMADEIERDIIDEDIRD